MKNSSKPLTAILDARYPTAYVLQKVLGQSMVRYDPIADLSMIGPCTKENIRIFKHGTAFKDSINPWGQTRFCFDMKSERKSKR